MKKLFVFSMVIVGLSLSCFAIGAGPTARSAGMGGCGIATANDISAAYFNPAGVQFGPENFEVQAFGGGQVQGLNNIMETASSGDNFIKDNLDKDIRLSSTLNGGMGLSVRRIGLSVLAEGAASFNKPAVTDPISLLNLNANFGAYVKGTVPLTLGTSISTPILPIASVAVGMNIKAIQEMYYGVELTPPTSGTSGSGTKTSMSGTGTGYDIGARANITPLISVGAVIRNLSTSVSRTIKTTTMTLESDGSISDVGDETVSKKTYNPDPEYGVGVGVVIPITGTLIACDIEQYSLPTNLSSTKTDQFTDVHIGIEQGFLFNLVMVRFGHFSYTPDKDEYYTWGLGLNAGPANIGISAANSVHDSNNSVVSYQVGVGI
jgi:hypothetical protein